MREITPVTAELPGAGGISSCIYLAVLATAGWSVPTEPRLGIPLQSERDRSERCVSCGGRMVLLVSAWFRWETSDGKED
jgi:hypothetical protein